MEEILFSFLLLKICPSWWQIGKRETDMRCKWNADYKFYLEGGRKTSIVETILPDPTSQGLTFAGQEDNHLNIYI